MHLHVLYECDGSGKAHGCAWIRLLNPLNHPTLAGKVTLTTGDRIPHGQKTDALIVERVYKPNLTIVDAEKIVEMAEDRGVPMIHTIDDNLLDLNTGPSIWHFPQMEQRHVLRYLMRKARGLIVSTEKLAERLEGLNPRIEVVPNQIDERLFTKRPQVTEKKDKIVIGYMGTPTHLDDLLMILQPLRRFLDQYREKVVFETVGVADAHFLQTMFPGLPARPLPVPRTKASYPDFARWMDANVQWDFAIAPLSDTSFAACKSDLKILDYGILGIPGIFSNVTSYRDTIRHGINGLLVENTPQAWEEALARMTDDVTLRAALAQNVRKEVWETRTLEQNAWRWEKAVERLVA